MGANVSNEKMLGEMKQMQSIGIDLSDAMAVRMDMDMLSKCYDLFDLGKTEVRGIKKVGTRPSIVSGWFTSPQALITALEQRENEPWQWYFVFNELDQTRLEDKSNTNMNLNCFAPAKNTIADEDVRVRRWIMIDVDPVREGNVSSNAEELGEALGVARKVYAFLQAKGFAKPVVALSGSGYHLMYPCKIEVSEESDTLIRDFLTVLAMRFDTERVKIDTVVHNRSRLTKLYGTVAKKGVASLERPWRTSHFLTKAERCGEVDIRFVEKVVEENLVREQRCTVYNDYGRKAFDVRAFLAKHSIGYKEKQIKGAVKFVLDKCVFNPEHKAPDSAVFQFDDGRLGFKCFHNSCSAYHWKEFREHLEPVSEAKPTYSSLDYNSFEQISSEGETKWLKLSEINALNADDILHIPTSFKDLDKCLNGGLAAGGISILTGVNGCGKTVFLNNLILNACDKEFRIGLWSGEMQSWRIKHWLYQIARGIHSDSDLVNGLIEQWLNDRLFIYNNNYGNRWEDLFESIRTLVESQGVNLVVLDNLACMDINRNNMDKYEQQSVFVKALAEYAKQAAIHIILVAHPRKSFGVVRKHDISGSYDLSNMADNVFIMHKVNDDFKKGAKEFWKESEVTDYSKFDSLIEVAKNRDMGDERVLGLFYERYSKRLKGDYTEILHYSWERHYNSPLL